MKALKRWGKVVAGALAAALAVFFAANAARHTRKRNALQRDALPRHLAENTSKALDRADAAANKANAELARAERSYSKAKTLLTKAANSDATVETIIDSWRAGS